MPRTQVTFYQDADGQAPVVNWLRELMETNEKAWAPTAGCDTGAQPY